MKVINEIIVCEVDGAEVDVAHDALKIESHWNWSDRVVLVLKQNEVEVRLTVIASELQKAIQNAVNFK